MVTDTWPLAGLTGKTYTQADGVFSFVAGQLDPQPGHVYQFAIQPGIDIVGAIEGVCVWVCGCVLVFQKGRGVSNS